VATVIVTIQRNKITVVFPRGICE